MSPPDTLSLADLSPELRVILAGVRGDPLPNDRISWERVGQLAAVHDVVPLLCRSWSGSTPEVPVELLQQFLKVRQWNAFLGLLGLQERDRAVGILDRAGIPCLVLKGGALAQNWYGDLSLRRFIDVDVLVPPHMSTDAQQALLGEDYIPVPMDQQTAYHEAPLCRPGGMHAIEVHHALTAMVIPRPASFQTLYARSISLSTPAEHVRTLSPEDMLIHLCVHMWQHFVQGGGWILRHLCDIERHVSAFSIDWPAFRAYADELGVRSSCAIALGLTTILLGAPIPEEDADISRASDILASGKPAQVDEHWLARLLVALRRGNVKHAVAIVRLKMTEGDGQGTSPQLHPLRLLGPAWRLARLGVTNPGKLTGQIRNWSAMERHRDQSQVLLPDLICSDEPVRAPLFSGRAILRLAAGRSRRE